MALIYVTNPGTNNDIRPNLQAAVTSAATSGDTIILPSGTFVYSGTISTTKSFTLKGAVPAQCTWNGYANNYSAETNTLSWQADPSTIIIRSEATSDASLESVSMITFTKSSRAPSRITVSDIEFRSKIPSDDGYPVNGGSSTAPDGLSLAADYALVFTKCVDVIVTRCKFKYFGNAAVRFAHYDDTANALIYKCDFYKNAKGKDGLGLGYGVVIYGEDITWNTPANFGTSNFTFIENCTFNLHRHAIASAGCARFVPRHNYIQDTLITYFRSCQAIDAHGSRSGTTVGTGNYHSTRCVEAYNNKIINTRYYTTGATYMSGAFISGGTAGRDEDDLIERGIHLKESEQIVYNNIIYGFRFGTGIQQETPNLFSGGYPQLYTMGYESGAANGPGVPNGDAQDSWLWNNTVHIFNGNCSNFYNYNTSQFLNNRDYHLSAYTYSGGSAYAYPHPLRATQYDLTLSTPNSAVTFNVNSPIVFTGTPVNFDIAVSGVQFFVNSVLVGTDLITPYTVSYTPLTATSYTLYAIGKDVSGNTVTSSTLTFSAQSACTNVQIALSGRNVKLGSNILSSCTISVLSTGATLPFTYSWSNSSTASTITVSPTANTSYSTTITDFMGCIASGSTLINVEDVRCNTVNVTSKLTYVNTTGGTGSTRVICLPNDVTTLMFTTITTGKTNYYPTIGSY